MNCMKKWWIMAQGKKDVQTKNASRLMSEWKLRKHSERSQSAHRLDLAVCNFLGNNWTLLRIGHKTAEIFFGMLVRSSSFPYTSWQTENFLLVWFCIPLDPVFLVPFFHTPLLEWTGDARTDESSDGAESSASLWVHHAHEAPGNNEFEACGWN